MLKSLKILVIPLVATLTACTANPSSEAADDDAEQGVTSQALKGPKKPKKPKYLALGDSVAFGDNPLLPYAPPWTSFVGYPDYASDHLKIGVTNASCMGETTATLLGTATFPVTGCQHGGLKVDYTEYGAANQIEYATAYLRDHRDTKLVTLNVGGNDLQIPFYLCGATSMPPPPSTIPCVQAQLPGMFAAYQQNLGTILSKIRATGYKKPLVVLKQYAFHYGDPLITPLIAQLNTLIAAVAAQHGAIVSDSFAAFQQAAASSGGDACAAGLLIPLPTGGCDIHPSAKGAELLANTLVDALDRGRGCDDD